MTQARLVAAADRGVCGSGESLSRAISAQPLSRVSSRNPAGGAPSVSISARRRSSVITTPTPALSSSEATRPRGVSGSTGR